MRRIPQPTPRQAATFSERLQLVLKNGNLTVADLSRFFNRPHPTVNGWVKRGLNPGGGPSDVENAYEMLERLESYMQRSKKLPVPLNMHPSRRIRYIKKLRNHMFNPEY
jgi:hypothetical protein